MVADRSPRGAFSRLSRLTFTAALLCATAPSGLAGTWTKVAHNAPGGVNLLLLMSDGTVMAARNNGSTIGSGWFQLTPDATGSYVNGTWGTLASMHDTRLYYSSAVLRDGRVFIAGGEYGTGGPRAEVYDPLTNAWTQTNPPAALWNAGSNSFVDSPCDVLPDGRVLIMPVFPKTSGVPLLYDPVTNTWANAGKLFRGSNQSEASWAKLPDDSILTIDPYGTFSERYIPATNTWVNDGIVPVSLYDPFGSELGGAVLLPSGKAFFLGSTGHNALYTPTGTVAPGTWVAAPDFPNGTGTPDAPCAPLITGNVLCAVSPKPTSANHFPSPTTFYEYDPVANGFTLMPAPTGTIDNIATYESAMLCLPDGSIMYSHFGSDTYVYRPTGSALPAGKPSIASITPNGDGSYHLVGTGLNGISEGASYGDDLQMNSNYPIVRLTLGGIVRYARTFNWSSTGVQTGATPVSTEFTLPASLPTGDYSLEVVANGIASDPVTFSVAGGATWADVGSGLAGIFGIPALTGTGSQVAGQPAEIDLIAANLSSPAVLFSGLVNSPTPFKGGLLVPVPWLVQLALATSGVGTIALPFAWPAGIPSGFSVYYQYAVKDPVAVAGVSLSNAMQSITP